MNAHWSEPHTAPRQPSAGNSQLDTEKKPRNTPAHLWEAARAELKLGGSRIAPVRGLVG